MFCIRHRSLAIVLAGAVGVVDAVAQSTAPAGIYTEAQAQRGREAYAVRCANCHGANLEGAGAPALAGTEFRRAWGRPNRTIDDLFYIMRTAMPRPSSGSLSTEQYLDLLAYLLQQNGLPAGKMPLVASPRLAALRLEQQPDSAARSSTKRAFITGERTQPLGKGPTQAELDAAATSTDWLYHTHDYAGTRYSPLSEITPSNAARLGVVCTFRVGDPSFFQAGPIVWNGVMYLSNIRVTVAIDATTCQERWRHVWQPQDTQVWPNNRGVAIKDGYVVRGTADGYLLALDAEDGKLLWARQVARPAAGETITMPPLIWEDRVFIGPAGSENNIRGWIGAFRLSDGEPLWRFNTIPTAGEPGAETWGNPEVPVGGGAIWTPLSLDHTRGELYVPVTNPAPDFPSQLRPGKNLYTNSAVALDVRTGHLRWYQQLVPNDFHDWDLTQVSPLFRTSTGGRERNVMSTVGKDGILRLLDRETQDRLWETPITTQLNVDTPFTTSAMVRFCPGALGGVQWNGPAWHPGTGLLLVPTVDWCYSGRLADTVRLIPGQIYLGGEAHPDSVGKQGWLTAVDARSGQVKWRYRSREPMVAAVTTSAGGVVFTGEGTGDFLALETETGKELYRFNTGGPIGGGLVTYAVEGRQYVAVTSGRPSPYFGATGSASVVVFALPTP